MTEERKRPVALTIEGSKPEVDDVFGLDPDRVEIAGRLFTVGIKHLTGDRRIKLQLYELMPLKRPEPPEAEPEAEKIIEFVNMHERLVRRAWALRPAKLDGPCPEWARLTDCGAGMIMFVWPEVDYDDEGLEQRSFFVPAEQLAWADKRIEELVAARDAEEESLNRSREAARAARIEADERAEYERLRQKFEPVIVESDKITALVVPEAAHFMAAPPSFAPGLSGGEIALDWITRNEPRVPPPSKDD